MSSPFDAEMLGEKLDFTLPFLEDDGARLITFYSFKGGVGRTMALANVGCQLANKHGKNVILVDWDLEAPGLHCYFDMKDEDLHGRPGLLDYLEDFKAEVDKGAEGVVPELGHYLQPLPEHLESRVKFGSVRLLACGDMGRDYMARVQNFDWDAFYGEHEGYMIIETLRQALMDKADLALIDARAGQADIGTVATIQLPDALVLLFTSNQQNLDGTAAIAQHLHNHPFRLGQGKKNPRILLVPSRVFRDDDRFDRWMAEVAQPMYDRLLADEVVSKEDQPRGLGECVLPVEPRFTFGEHLPILTHSGPSTLKASYAVLASAIYDLYLGRAPWLLHRLSDLPNDESSLAKLTEEMAAAAERGDEHGLALIRLKACMSLWKSNANGAIDHAQAALTHFTAHGDIQRAASAALLLGNLQLKINKPEIAIAYLETTRALGAEIGNKKLEAGACNGIGLYWKIKSNTDKAISAFRKSSELLPENKYAWFQICALLMQKRENYDEAEAAILKATELDPSDFNFIHCLGLILLLQQRHDEAECALRKAIELAPHYGPSWDALGIALANQPGRDKDAEVAFRKGIELGWPDAEKNLALLLNASAKMQKSADHE